MRPHSPMVLYPVNLDISGRLCVVIGGGAVAARKIEALLLSGAVVRIVSPNACGKIRAFAEKRRVEWLQRDYQNRDVCGAFLVFAATNSAEVQRQVAVQAVKEGALLNSADNPEQCDFQVPAKIRRRNLLIAVSTGGGSPALSALIIRKIGKEFGSEYGLLVELMAKLRVHTVGAGEPSEKNRRLFHKVLELPLLECIRKRRWAELQQHLTAVLPITVDSALLVAELERETGKQFS